MVGQGAIVGHGADLDTPNRDEPGRLNTGITVVGKRAVIPRGTRIGRNVRIASEARVADFPGRVVKTGTSVNLHGDRRLTDGSAVRGGRMAGGIRRSMPSAAGEAPR
jgi:glucose-1-phosphate adenylyltransferase